MGAPESRWEFGVIMSGWGVTKEEAWSNVLDNYFRSGEKEGCQVMDVAVTDKDVRKFRREGRDYVMRCEIDPACCGPGGTMLVWEEDS